MGTDCFVLDHENYFSKEKVMFARFFKDESGVTSIEYALIAAATGLTLVALMPAIEAGLTTTFTDIGNAMQ